MEIVELLIEVGIVSTGVEVGGSRTDEWNVL